jgi:polar amino acid transport system substrate-binding protein
LDVSKIEAGKLELEETDFDLDELFSIIARDMELRCLDKHLTLAVNCKLCTTMVCSDPVRIRQIVDNLIGNAIKFTAEGEINVDVKLIETETGLLKLQCDVNDTGEGIGADSRKLLFKPFKQLDSSTTRKFGGTGLGLSICKDLVQLMGGQISVSSEPGSGSCFSFEVLLKKVSDQNLGVVEQ